MRSFRSLDLMVDRRSIFPLPKRLSIMLGIEKFTAVLIWHSMNSCEPRQSNIIKSLAWMMLLGSMVVDKLAPAVPAPVAVTFAVAVAVADAPLAVLNVDVDVDVDVAVVAVVVMVVLAARLLLLSPKGHPVEYFALHLLQQT